MWRCFIFFSVICFFGFSIYELFYFPRMFFIDWFIKDDNKLANNLDDSNNYSLVARDENEEDDHESGV